MHSLVLDILYHFLLSIPLTGVIWFGAWTGFALTARQLALSPSLALLLSYPLGLLLLVSGSALVLYSPWITLVVLLYCAATLIF